MDDTEQKMRTCMDNFWKIIDDQKVNENCIEECELKYPRRIEKARESLDELDRRAIQVRKGLMTYDEWIKFLMKDVLYNWIEVAKS